MRLERIALLSAESPEEVRPLVALHEQGVSSYKLPFASNAAAREGIADLESAGAESWSQKLG